MPDKLHWHFGYVNRFSYVIIYLLLLRSVNYRVGRINRTILNFVIRIYDDAER